MKNITLLETAEDLLSCAHNVRSVENRTPMLPDSAKIIVRPSSLDLIGAPEFQLGRISPAELICAMASRLNLKIDSVV